MGITTANLGLYKPDIGEEGWGTLRNANEDVVDVALGVQHALSGVHNFVTVTNSTGYVQLPTLDTTERDALTPINGMMIYNSSVNQIQSREAGAWANIALGSSTFSDTDFRIQDDGDATKQLGFQVSAITTATTRTITMPDSDVDLADIATNSAKVTNATHSGDASGATALTAQPALITGKGSGTVATGDLILISDIDDTNALKQVTAQSIANLAPGGVEVNNLEVVTTDIETTEIPIGTATDTVVYAPLSGDVSMDNGGVVTVSGGNADTVTTNADLTGVVTSSGNATAIADKALAIAKLADGTDGELITWDASGVIDTVAVGTADDVLTSNGVGVAPTFQTPAGGGGSVAENFQYFTANGTWTKPAAVSTVYVQVWGGGGGGANDGVNGGGGGGGAGHSQGLVAVSGNVTVTVGAAGGNATGGGGNGGNGGLSRFAGDTTLTGNGGTGGGATGTAGGGGSGSGGTFNRTGQPGGTGASTQAGNGGGSTFGGSSSQGSTTGTNAQTASFPGGGGGSAVSGQAAVAGSAGLVIVSY